MAATPTLHKFLGEIGQLVTARDGTKLQDFLIIEPPYSQLYLAMIQELKLTFPYDNDEGLEALCSKRLTLANEDEWSSFSKFLVSYLTFIRDVNIENLLETYNLLSELVQ